MVKKHNQPPRSIRGGSPVTKKGLTSKASRQKIPSLPTAPQDIQGVLEKAAKGTLTAYLAPMGFEAQTQACLRDILYVDHQLMICAGKEQWCPWAQESFPEVEIHTITSIRDGGEKLKKLRHPWTAYSPRFFRRTELILEQAQSKKQRAIFSRELEFPAEPLPTDESVTAGRAKPTWGTICLLDEHHMLVAPQSSRPFPLGISHFREFKKGPPSRAYLKLFEALTILGSWPHPDDLCLEIGAAPGGWTWVLQRLGARVLTYDRAPLDPSLLSKGTITHHQTDAFTAIPAKMGEGCHHISWIFSDIICYPQKLLAWVKSWLAVRDDLNFVCTLKFQGNDHYDVIPEFAKISHSKLVHLYHNKHELTWIRCPKHLSSSPNFLYGP